MPEIRIGVFVRSALKDKQRLAKKAKVPIEPKRRRGLTASSVSAVGDGVMHAETPEAARFIKLLGLNSKRYVEVRELWIGIRALALRHDPELLRRLVVFPDDLPDRRRLKPPGGNIRPDGVARSDAVMREAPEIPTD